MQLKMLVMITALVSLLLVRIASVHAVPLLDDDDDNNDDDDDSPYDEFYQDDSASAEVFNPATSPLLSNPPPQAYHNALTPRRPPRQQSTQPSNPDPNPEPTCRHQLSGADGKSVNILTLALPDARGWGVMCTKQLRNMLRSRCKTETSSVTFGKTVHEKGVCLIKMRIVEWGLERPVSAGGDYSCFLKMLRCLNKRSYPRTCI